MHWNFLNWANGSSDASDRLGFPGLSISQACSWLVQHLQWCGCCTGLLWKTAHESEGNCQSGQSTFQTLTKLLRCYQRNRVEIQAEEISFGYLGGLWVESLFINIKRRQLRCFGQVLLRGGPEADSGQAAEIVSCLWLGNTLMYLGRAVRGDWEKGNLGFSVLTAAPVTQTKVITDY